MANKNTLRTRTADRRLAAQGLEHNGYRVSRGTAINSSALRKAAGRKAYSAPTRPAR